MTHFTLALKDILKRKHFESCEIIAGHNGMHRAVKWVHVFEVTEVGDLLKGDELILSTGFGWKDNEDELVPFLKQLIKKSVAGLCIEIGKYTKGVSKKVKDIADQHDFPIILFYNEVPFVEITQDIHAHLINQHYQMISNLEGYSQRLNKKLLSINSHYEILVFLQRYLNLQVVYLSDNGDAQFIPELSPAQKNKVLKMINSSKSTICEDSQIISQNVQILDRDYAKLYVISPDRELGEFESLILDRTVTALSQHLLRILYTEEKRKAEETEWILEWLQGEHDDNTIKEHLAYYEGAQKLKGAVVCIIKLITNGKQHISTDITYLKMLVQTIFDQNGFYSLTVEKRNNIIFILNNKRDINDWRERVEEGVSRLANSTNIADFNIAIGQYVTKLSDVNKSYQTAKETIGIQEKLKEDKKRYFFEDLHMYRLISLVHKHSDLNSFVNEYLEPVLNYDRKHNANLMETLKTYLECSGSKKETAKRIFVVRQTLYHRIEKLEKLLGTDFMSSEKRQVLEFSILAYEYLESVKGLNTESVSK